MQKRLFITGILSAAMVLMAQPLGAQTPQGEPAGMHRLRGPVPKPKNLQVLPKDISHDQLMKVMHGFAGSLGVKCEYCHAPGPQPRHLDFASDAKPQKRIARTMLRMTMTINDKYLSQVDNPDAKPDQKNVTCGTCHRGQKMPAVFVLPPEHKHGMPGGPSKPE